jgi:hypothetical protein
MNEPFDPLEAELAALEPRGPTAELSRRIAEHLEREATPEAAVAPKQQTIRRILSVVMIATVAASLLLAIVLRRSDYIPPADPLPDRLQPPLATAFDPSLPSVWTYYRAVSAAPDEIDALLDKHASARAQPARPELHVSTFPMVSTDLQSFLGEL